MSQLWNEVKLGMIPVNGAAAGLGQGEACSFVSQSAHHFFGLFYSNGLLIISSLAFSSFSLIIPFSL